MKGVETETLFIDDALRPSSIFVLKRIIYSRYKRNLVFCKLVLGQFDSGDTFTSADTESTETQYIHTD